MTARHYDAGSGLSEVVEGNQPISLRKVFSVKALT